MNTKAEVIKVATMAMAGLAYWVTATVYLAGKVAASYSLNIM